MKSRNLILLVLFALLITPVLAVAPTSNFYLVPTDMKVYSMVPYDAMVYQDGTYTIAVNRTGGIINATLTSSHADDIPIQAAIAYLDGFPTAGGNLKIGSGIFWTKQTITITHPHIITGSGVSATYVRAETGVTTMFNINLTGDPTCSLGCFNHVEMSEMTLDGWNNAQYGITFGDVGTYNYYVTDSSFTNMVITEFLKYGVYENSDFGSTYNHVTFGGNGIRSGYSEANLDTGGIAITSNANTFIGCDFEWNSVGVVLKNGIGTAFYNTIIEGNYYHGVFGYSGHTPDPRGGERYPGSPRSVLFSNTYVEDNGQHNKVATPWVPLYDIYTNSTDCSYWNIDHGWFGGTYVERSILLEGISSSAENTFCDVGECYPDNQNILITNVANGGETGTITEFIATGSTLSSNTANHWQGSRSVKVVTANTGNDEGFYTGFTPIQPLTTYNCSIYVKGDSGGETRIYLSFAEYTSSGNWINTVYSPEMTLSTGWQRIFVNRTTSSTGGKAVIGVRKADQASVTFYVDGAQLEANATATDWVP